MARAPARAVRAGDASAVGSERELVGLALELGAERSGELSRAERALARRGVAVASGVSRRAAAAIAAGFDPLGTAFCRLRSAVERRASGAVYTPASLVAGMLDWCAAKSPSRVVDPGAGSGRFVLAAGERFPEAELVAVERDPLAALLLRAQLAQRGFAERARVEVGDYRALELPTLSGTTLFVGNPPYVRHHLLEAGEKRWFADEARLLGLRASKLAGLHAHFLLQTARLARAGDYGAFVTAAEWLDTGYGDIVRRLCLGPLGALSLHVVEPAVRPFDADTTAVILCFEAGSRRPRIAMRRVAEPESLAPLIGGRAVPRDRLAESRRWTPLLRRERRIPSGYVELGELCDVHRGQVTGKNQVWIAGEHSAGLPPQLLFPSVTRARELFDAGGVLADGSRLRCVIDLPAELDCLLPEERAAVERFLRTARKLGADRGFVARHRKAWWSVGLKRPAPILATYMARRPPAFVHNLAGVRHINIAHGLYPRIELAAAVFAALLRHLSNATEVGAGRTYAGGLTKFEPGEMQRLMVPGPALLAELAERERGRNV